MPLHNLQAHFMEAFGVSGLWVGSSQLRLQFIRLYLYPKPLISTFIGVSVKVESALEYQALYGLDLDTVRPRSPQNSVCP